MNRSFPLRIVELLLVAAGSFLLGWWFNDWHQTRTFQSQASQILDARRALKSLPGEQPKSHRRSSKRPSQRAVIGRIEIPRLKISAVIVQGTEPEILDRAVGHFAFTALPGEPGNVGLAGHRDTFLRGLGKIRENDIVTISTADTTLRYRVQDGTVVNPDRVDVLDPTLEPSLTLVTCYPFHFVGPAPQRYVVRALLEQEPKARTAKSRRG